MKQFLLLFILLCNLLELQAQTVSRKVLATMGGTYEDSNFQATFTVGETIISTMSNGNLLATQGFQQPPCFSDSSAFAVTSVDTYVWNSTTYTVSGAYTHTYINMGGCDSTVTLNLTIYHTTVTMTLQNVVQISPSVFEYDVMLTNTGNTTLALRGYSCGINHAAGMRDGGTLTHTFISRDASFGNLPNPVPGYTASTNHLRIVASNTANGSEINLSPGVPLRIATMRVSNTVPFPSDFVPNFTFQTLTAIGKTSCIATCVVTPPGIAYNINGTSNVAVAGTIQGLTGVVNTPCLYLHPTTSFAIAAAQSAPVTCSGQSNGMAQITLSGNGATSASGTYTLDAGAAATFSSNTFLISNLSAGTHTIVVTTNYGCTGNAILTITEPFMNSTSTNQTTCDSYTWEGVTYTASGTITHTYLSAAGCDSLHTENFTINHSYSSSSSVNVCGSYSWNGATYTATGTYIQTYTNSSGCDSTLTLNLIVNPVPAAYIIATGPTSFCDGNSVALHANLGGALTYKWLDDGIEIMGATSSTYIVSQSGDYTVEVTNSSNCSALSSPQVVTANSCDVDLHLKLFMQGYYLESSTMVPTLLNQIVSTDNTVTDTILVDLHSAQAPYGLVLSQQAVLHTDGSAVCSFNYVNGNYYLAESYYVAIRHRNGLTTWSANPVAFNSNSILYDFSSSSSQAYGDNMLEVEPGVWAMYTGELNYDDNIDLLDISVMEPDITIYENGYFATDLNGDGNVDLLDMPFLEMNVFNFIYSTQPSWSGTLPIVTSSAVTSITGGSAVCGGNVISNGGSPITARGVCWSVNPHPTINDSMTTNGTGTGSYSSSLSNLDASTTYFVRAYATSSVGTVYGNEVSFVSGPLSIGQTYQGGIIAYILQPGDPGYVVGETRGLIVASNIQGTAQWGCSGQQLVGTSTSFGSGESNTAIIVNNCGTGTAAYICDTLTLSGYSDWYLPSKNELASFYDNQLIIGGFGQNVFWSSSEENIDNAYYFLFYNGSSYGNWKYVNSYFVRAVRSFSDQNTIGVTTNPVNDILQTTATCGGSVVSRVGAPVTARGVCWSTSPNPTVSLSTKTIDGSVSGSFTSSITGLIPGTSYHVRAYATSNAGTVYGNDITFTTTTLSIGDNFEGGKVAYIFQPGDNGYVTGEVHGLIAAPSDQSTGIVGWNGFYIATGANGTALGTGNANTNTIVSVQGNGTYAAKLCSDLVLNGYNDWYLPSKDELNKLYLNQSAIGGFYGPNYYWSSSEYDNTFVWGQRFDNGTQTYALYKNYPYFLRAVRAF